MPRALPRLEGRWLVAFTILWAILLPFAVAMPVLSVVNGIRLAETPVWLPIGLSLDTQSEQVRVYAVTTREARAAGIRAGDTVLAVDGYRVRSGNSGYEEIRPRLIRPEGTRFAVSIRGADGRIRTVRLTRRLAHIDEPFEGSVLNSHTMLAMGLIGGVLPALFFVPAAILLFRRRREPVPLLLSFALLMLAAGEFIGTNGWTAAGLPDRLGQLVGICGWSCLLLVLLTFPTGAFRPAWTRWLGPFLLVWILLFALKVFLYLVSAGLLIALMAAAVVNLALRYRRMEPGPERQQMRWFLFGFGAGTFSFVIALLLTVLSEVLFRGDVVAGAWLQVLFYVFGPLGGVLIACGLLVSLLRYRLYDAESVISRSAGIALLTLILAAIFAASSEAIEALFELRFGQDAGALPGAAGAGLAVMMITPLHRRIEAWIDRRFRKALGHLRRDLPDCVEDLRETAGMTELLDEVLARVEAGSRAVRSAVSVDGRIVASRGIASGEARPEDFPLAVPLRIGHSGAELGTLLVGSRPDGSRLGRDEREALEEVADPVARAIRIVKAREERESATATALAAIERRLGRIEKGAKNG